MPGVKASQSSWRFLVVTIEADRRCHERRPGPWKDTPPSRAAKTRRHFPRPSCCPQFEPQYHRRASIMAHHGVCVSLPLSSGATEEGKGQEGQCRIGHGGRHQRVQCATASASWRRDQLRHIAGVCLPPPLVLSRMVEARKTNIPLNSRTQQ